MSWFPVLAGIVLSALIVFGLVGLVPKKEAPPTDREILEQLETRLLVTEQKLDRVLALLEATNDR